LRASKGLNMEGVITVTFAYDFRSVWVLF